jgi:hypothetical protein
VLRKKRILNKKIEGFQMMKMKRKKSRIKRKRKKRIGVQILMKKDLKLILVNLMFMKILSKI